MSWNDFNDLADVKNIIDFTEKSGVFATRLPRGFTRRPAQAPENGTEASFYT